MPGFIDYAKQLVESERDPDDQLALTCGKVLLHITRTRAGYDFTVVDKDGEIKFSVATQNYTALQKFIQP